MPNDKQLTAMQELIERLQKAEDEANKQAENFRVLGLQATQLTSEAMAVAYSISRKHATELLQKEKENSINHAIDFGVFVYSYNCDVDINTVSRELVAEDYEKFTQTFKK